MNLSKYFILLLALIITSILLFACGSNIETVTTPKSLATITVTPATKTLRVGDTFTFTAVGYDSTGGTVSMTPTWSVMGSIGMITSAGTFTATASGLGSVVATSSSISGSSEITVTSASVSPELAVSTTSLTYSATQGGSNPSSQSVTIANTGGGTLTWSASKSSSWLTISPTSGDAPSSLTGSVDVSGLTYGTYVDTIEVTSNGGNQNISVTLNMATAEPTTASISISGFAFNPSTLTISAGTIVTWTNNDGVSHTATSTSGSASFDSGTLSNGGTYSVTFTTTGTYNYQCNFHPSMTGTIQVN